MHPTVVGPATVHGSLAAAPAEPFHSLRVPCRECLGRGKRCAVCGGTHSIAIDVRSSQLQAEHLGLLLPDARLRAIETLRARGAVWKAQRECLTHALCDAHRALIQLSRAPHTKRTMRIVAGATLSMQRWRALARACTLPAHAASAQATRPS